MKNLLRPAVLAALFAFAAFAQAFPIAGKPVRIVVPFAPGGQTDIQAHGHTLLYTIATHVQIPHLYREAPWDPFRDFTPITAGARSATVLTAHVSAPFNTVQELVAYAKANPGKLNYASFGAGSTSHLNGEMLKRLAGIDMVHVPYKGSGREAGFDVGMWGYLWFWGPAGMPAATVDAVYQPLARAIDIIRQIGVKLD